MIYIYRVLLIIIRNSMIEGNYNVLQQSFQCPLSSQSENYSFMFVNSKSGDGIGQKLLKQHSKQIKVSINAQSTMIFLTYDLYNQQQRNQAFVDIQAKIKLKKTVYIIICGGDGTIQWVIQESLKSNIDLTQVVFGVLPIGTGNDFAKSIGWKDYKFSVSKQKIQQLALQISKCQIKNYDIWTAEIECFENGSIIQIKNGIQIEKVQKSLSKNFTNYFGIGTDAQICYIAQKLKAKTILLKKIAYGFAGFLSFWMFCGGLKSRIKQMVQVKTIQDSNSQMEMTESNIQQKPDSTEKIKLSKFDCSFVFLNSTSSMDLLGVWETPWKVNSKGEYKKQCIDDGTIQIVSYFNQISICFQRLLHMARKVAQGRGPFIINFKQPRPGQTLSTYVHINGQPYKVNNIKSVKISQSSLFPQSKIKVLCRQN